MDESSSTMSLGDLISDNSPSVVKPKLKKRSFIERQLETNLTEKITSPTISNDGTSTSRYGRALRFKMDVDFCDTDKTVEKSVKSPKFDKSPVKVQSPVYKMHASNSPLRGSPKKHISQSPNMGMSLASNLEDQIENIYNENLSLSRFASNDTLKKESPTKKSTKIYVRKDLIQSREKEETITLIRNMFSPVKSAYKSPKTHIGSTSKRSVDKYSLNSKSQNGYLDTSSVVKALNFDSKNKYKDLKEKPKAVPTKSDIFEMEAKCDYQVGDLTWARVGTYPFWPGIVTRDPLSGTFVKKKMFGRLERDVIHVTFLGDKGRRGWVVDNMLRKYLGVMEFEATREKFTPEDKKKDPKFYAAFFISDKKQAFWNTSIEEAEILLKEPKRLRIDTFNTMLGRVKVTKNTPKRDNPKLNRSNSDVSLSETLYDSLFSVNDNKNNDTVKSKNKSRNSSVDVSEVVTACLDNMAAKTGMTKIKRQSHMDRWLQKAKCTNPETPKTKPQPVVHKSEESKAKKKSMNVSTRHTKRNGTQKQMENISYLSENSNHSSVALVDNEQNSVISIDSDSNTNSDSDNLISKRLRNKNRESKTETDLNKSTNSKNNENDVISSVSDCTIGSTNIQILNQIDGKGVSNVLKDTDLHEIDNDLDKSSLANNETKKIITESEIQNEVTNKIVNKEIMSLNSCDTQTDKTMLKDLCSNVDIEGNHNSNNVDECTRFDVIDSGCTPQTTNCDNTGDTPNLNNDVTVIDKSVKCKNICDDMIKIQIKGKEIEGCSMANHSEDNMCFTKNLIPKISPNNGDVVIKDTVFIQDPVSQISDKNDVELMDSDKNVINVDIKENQTKNKHIIIENSLSINNTDKYDKEKPFNDGIILECKSNVENVEDDSMISTQDRNGISQDSVSDTTEVLVSFSNQGNQENNKSLTMDDKLIIKTDNERNTICIPETMINMNRTENRANGDDKVIQVTLNHANLNEDGKTHSHDDIDDVGMISKNIENRQTIIENDVSGFSDGNSQHTKEDDLLNTESLIDDYLNECELKLKHNLIENSEDDIMKNIVDNYNKEYNACGQNVIESQRLVDLNCDTNAKNIESSAISTSNETNDDCLVQKVLKNGVSEENLEKYSVVNENQITENHNNTLRHNVTDDDLNVNNNEVQNIVPIEKFDNDLTKQQKTDVIELKGDSTSESLKSDVIKSPMPIDNGMIRDNGDDRSLSKVNDFKAVLEKSEIIENGHIEKNENNSEGVVKECDPGTPTIKLERCVTPISKRKTRTKSDKIQNVDNNSEKVNVSKALQDREFVTYMEFKQDGLLEENPELTQEEIVTYLYKTWLYEESKKSDFEKTDEIEQSGLIKGLNKDVAPLPKKVKKKAKVEKVEAEVLEEISKEKPKRRVVKPLYNEDIFDFEDEIKLFEIFDKKEPKLKEIAKNSESVDEEFFEIIEDVDDEPLGAKEEIYFEQLTEPKPNLFKGFVREKVCEICEAPTNLVKCKGCHCMFHVACVKKEVETIDAPVLNKGRKKKRKPKGRRPKDGGSIDSESHSDEKSQDVNVSDELNMSIDDIESEFHIVADADTVEALLSAKMKELLENAENIDYNLHYEGELDWSKSIAGKCEIIDVTLKTNVPTNFEDYSDFKCNNCQKYDTPICFVCRSNLSPKNQVEFRQKCQVPQCHRYYHLECLDHWPQTKFSSGEPSKNNKKLNQHFEAISCPRHVCHTCVCDDPRGCKTRFSGDKLARCVKCPATYHSFTKCLPAGTQILTGSHIICPRHYQHRPGKVPCHVNTGWCFICALGGTLICCEYCPTSFHAECLNIKPPEGGYMCEDCETGRLPLYGEMVWVKLGHYRWWPGIILHPSEIPYNILTVKHSPGEFVVRFFGQYDHYWVNRGRVFPFQEGDSGRISKQKSKIDEAFTLAMDHAQRACEILKTLDTNNEEASEINSSLLPPHYVKLKVNKPCGAVSIRRDDEAESLTQCDCDPDLEEPCGPHSQCLNRMLLTECGPSCRAGDRCNNRAFEQRLYPKLEPYRTPHRGWGLRTLEDIKQGQFVIEYVGELIDEEEFQRRMRRKHEQRDENFYFLTLDKERMIDAGPKGNLARFMNHCCEPNCETQKWTVLGDIRVGLFAIYDIPANSEVTFNYNLESAGIEKKQCFCGANRCSGYIGAKPKQEEIPKKIKKTHKKRKALETSPLITKSKPKPRLARVKPKELTEIEKDLLIIQNATNGISSDSETSSRLSSIESDKIFRDTRAIKRKRVDFSIEEVGLHNGGDSPNVKRAKIDDKDAVGDV